MTPETILGSIEELFQKQQQCFHTELCKPFQEH